MKREMKKKIAVVECKDYDPQNVLKSLNIILDYLEIDISKLKNREILIKPNLLMRAKPEAAITTHPAIIDSLVKIIKKVSSDIVIGDSPGYAHLFSDKMDLTGMREISEINQIPLVDLGKTTTYLYKPPNSSCIFPISELAKQKYVISVPKAKISKGVLLTCAVKNIFGCVAGEAKVQLHTCSKNATAFYLTLNDICNEVMPELTIVDAINIMEGNGPDKGNPAHLGLLFGGTDPFAVDVAVAWSMGLNPLAIGTLRYHYGISYKYIDEIELVGAIKEKFPLYRPQLPKVLSGRFLNWEGPRLEL